MSKEKEAMVEALIRYYLIELFHYNNTGMFDDIDAILHNLSHDVFDKREFDYESFADKYSHVNMLKDLLLSYQNSEELPEKEKSESKRSDGFCEACECNPCDCNWGAC